MPTKRLRRGITQRRDEGCAMVEKNSGRTGEKKKKRKSPNGRVQGEFRHELKKRDRRGN